MSPNDSLQFDPFPAIEKLRPLFELPELANRTIEGGWELVFRNQLLRELQKLSAVKSSDHLFDREALVVPGKVADIAIFKADDGAKSPNRNPPHAIFEIKHNFATQCEVFTELKGAMEKWKDWKDWRKEESCEFHYIQIVTDIRRLAGAKCKGCCIYPSKDKGRKGETCDGFCSSICAEVFKYRIQPDEKARTLRMRKIRDHLEGLQSCLKSGFTLELREEIFSVQSKKYLLREIDYDAKVHVFLVSQRKVSEQPVNDLPFENKSSSAQSQTPLLNFSKRGRGRVLSAHCKELP